MTAVATAGPSGPGPQNGSQGRPRVLPCMEQGCECRDLHGREAGTLRVATMDIRDILGIIALSARRCCRG